VARQTRIAYDGQPWGAAPTRGSPTAVMRGLDGWGWVTTTTQYDDRGNPIATADPLGRVTRTDYDPVYHQYPISTTNPLTQTTRMEWDLRLSVPTVITDANGAATRLGYDPFGRLITVTYPGESAPAVRYAYPTGASISAPWAITTEVRVDPYSATPTYGRSWTFYDGLGRPVQTQTAAENGWLVVQDTAYDALGRAVTVTLPYTVTATGGVYRTPNWTALPKTVTQYDALGRVVQVTAPDGSVTRRAYRDWREMVLDAEGHQTEYEKDGLGRLIAVREYYGTYITPTWNPGETPAETRYWYDAADNLIGVRDGLGNVTRIAYDPLGRKTAMDDPSMGHWEYRYDAAGNLTGQKDARGQELTFQYDALDRLTRKSAGGEVLAEYGYDQGPNGIGRRTAMTDTTGVTTWRYDARGRVLTETRTLTGIGTFTTGWGYDAAGRVVRQVYPDGEVVTTAYNLRGLPTAVVGQSPYLTGAAYNALGRPLRQNWGNGRVTAYAYHPQSARLTQLTVSGNLLDLRYGYDRVGNITAITDTVNNNQVQTFGYDARDRLVWARTSAAGNGQYSETYGYDRMGNILTRTVGSQTITYTYGCPPVIAPALPSTLPHRVWFPLVMKGYGPDSPPPPACTAPFAVVRTSTGFRAEYDPNGNMVLRVEVSGTQRITYTQEYNAENRLAVVTNTVTGQVTRFVYDGDGNRVLRIGPEGTTVYIGDYYEQTGSTVRKYYYAAGQRMAVRVGGALYFLHGDHLGSATLTTDGGGNWVGEARYTPYGEMRRDYPRGVIPTDRLYTGQRQETFGLYDYRARYYHPGLGRFISADPVVPEPGNPQALNRYAYVYNNPLGYIDPTGHFSEEELLRYGVFNGPRQMAAYQADEFHGADWYWALRAAEEGDWLETWWSFWHGFHSSGMVKARGQFRVADGMLLLTLESGPSYRVRFWGLQGLENPEIRAYPSGLALEKPEGVRLYGVESLRRYVRQAEGGEHPITEGDYWEVTAGGYFGIGGHISARRDRFGRIYVGLNVGLGGGKWGFSIAQGHLVQDYDPDPAQLDRVLGGWQVAIQGGYYAGGSISAVDFGPIPVQYGFTWPGWAFSLGYAWRVR
jgi:RHS repeat-associated protein